MYERTDCDTVVVFNLQLKISDQTYSIGAFLGKDPEDVKHQKQEKLEQQIVEVSVVSSSECRF